MTERLPPLTRFPDWPKRLNAYFTTVGKNTFDWKTFHCCIFSGGAVEAMTGVDPMPEFRDVVITNQEEANKVLQQLGEGTLFKTLYKKFGKPTTGVKGQRGDLGMFEGACGIITGRACIFVSEYGYRQVPITQIKRAFKVGH